MKNIRQYCYQSPKAPITKVMGVTVAQYGSGHKYLLYLHYYV